MTPETEAAIETVLAEVRAQSGEREKNRRQLEGLRIHEASPFAEPETSTRARQTLSLIADAESATLKELLALPSAAGQMLGSKREGLIAVLDTLRFFRAAKRFVEPATAREEDYAFALLGCRHNSGNATSAVVVDVINYVRVEGEFVPIPGVIHDLTQFWRIAFSYFPGVREHPLVSAFASLCKSQTRYAHLQVISDHIDIHTSAGSARERCTDSRAKRHHQRAVEQRVDKVARHLQRIRRNSERVNRSTYHRAQPDLRDASFALRDEQVSALWELVHLNDHFEKYQKASGVSAHGVAKVDHLGAFRIARSAINSHKHGARGRNKAVTLIQDSPVFICEGSAGSARSTDRVVGISHLVNYRGALFEMGSILDDVALMWLTILRGSTDCCINSLFTHRVHVATIDASLTTYSTPFPANVLANAKRESDDAATLAMSGSS